MGYGPEYQDPRYSGGMRDIRQNPEMGGGDGGMGTRDMGPNPGMGGMGGMGIGGMGQNPLAFGGLAPIGKAFKKIIGRVSPKAP
jgi:hypothetical protein